MGGGAGGGGPLGPGIPPLAAGGDFNHSFTFNYLLFIHFLSICVILIKFWFWLNFNWFLIFKKLFLIDFRSFYFWLFIQGLSAGSSARRRWKPGAEEKLWDRESASYANTPWAPSGPERISNLPAARFRSGPWRTLGCGGQDAWYFLRVLWWKCPKIIKH